MAEVTLTKNKVAIVDDDDIGWIAKHKWCFLTVGYAVRGERRSGKTRMVYMHREIVGAKPGEEVDHINGNKLDNRRCNLRICTRSQNVANQGLKKNNTTGLRGVFFDRARDKWMARIKCDGKVVNLGRFSSPQEAAIAYDRAATNLFGEFAWTNQPRG